MSNETFSAVLMDFAQPALLSAPPEASFATYRLLFTLAVRVWNESVTEAVEGGQGALAAIEADLAQTPEPGRTPLTEMAVTLYDRKRAYFRDDLRLVRAWEMTPTKRGFSFACDPSPPARS
jgi:hypothetical protein